MNTIEIKSSNIKLLLLILGCLLILLLGVFMTINPEKLVSRIFRNVFFIRIVGICAILLAGFCLPILCKGFLLKKFNLIIDEKGITDNSSFASVGLIDWKDIVSIKTISVASQNFLLIDVKDPQKYLNVNNRLKKRILKNTLQSYGTPISISSSALKTDFDKLEKVILKFYNEYGNR